MLNYFEIGQRIRKFRKANGLSQENLAEKVSISVPHMSHIETGNTKLSLQVLVDISEALGVKTDDLLYDYDKIGHNSNIAELEKLLQNADTKLIKVLVEIVKSANIAIEKYLK